MTVTADGCLPCVVAGPATVPMLAIFPSGTLHGGDGAPLPLRTPADDEKLVAATTELPPAAADLFPAARLLPVRLDPAAPLAGPPAAWEVLDAVLLDGAAMSALTDARRSALLAGGVTLAVTEGPPDARWPWQRRGRLWVLSYPPAGPTADVVLPDAYGPTESWTPRWSAALRAGAAVVGVLISIATVAIVALGRARLAVTAAVALPVVAAVGVAGWRATLDRVAQVRGDVTVTTPMWTQHDAWVYERARSAADVTVPWAGWTHPAFAARSSLAAARPRLTVSADGHLAFEMHLATGSAMAFVRREVGPAAPPPPTTGGRGAPMRDLASLYLSAGTKVDGETAAGPWSGVSIVRPR